MYYALTQCNGMCHEVGNRLNELNKTCSSVVEFIKVDFIRGGLVIRGYNRDEKPHIRMLAVELKNIIMVCFLCMSIEAQNLIL